MTSADKIAAWRAANPGATLTESTLTNALGVPNLTGADLSGANLYGANLNRANLTGAKLTGANLNRANLNRANLTWANLTWANLSGANLNRANLTWANLAGANVHQTGLLTLDTPSGQVRVFPVEGRWEVCIGCWRGGLDGLADIINDRAEWPEAEGEERELRRPILAALHALISAHIAYPASEKLRASTEPAKEKETS